MKDFTIGDRVSCDNGQKGTIIRITSYYKDIVVRFDNGTEKKYDMYGIEKTDDPDCTFIDLMEDEK